MSHDRMLHTAALPGAVGVLTRVPPKEPRENRITPPARPRSAAGSAAARPATRPGTRGPGSNSDSLGPLTALGVSLLLVTACVLGALFDLVLVGGPAWALISLYIAACGYTATRVRPSDWFCALVAPPIAFAVAIVLLAMIMPNSFASGLIGTAATTFELLAAKARALYTGVSLSALVLFARRAKARRGKSRRPGPPRPPQPGRRA
jgi:hypothetical protein